MTGARAGDLCPGLQLWQTLQRGGHLESLIGKRCWTATTRTQRTAPPACGCAVPHHRRHPVTVAKPCAQCQQNTSVWLMRLYCWTCRHCGQRSCCAGWRPAQAALAALACAYLAGSPARPSVLLLAGLSALAVACAAAVPWLNGLVQQFYFVDYVHQDKK